MEGGAGITALHLIDEKTTSQKGDILTQVFFTPNPGPYLFTTAYCLLH